MPYELKFTGDYFEIADFLKVVDGLVHTRGAQVAVHGRLMTVDAFSLEPVESETSSSPIPTLTASLVVTTYLTPADQGITAGATPSGPPPATSTPVAGSDTSTTSTSGSVPSAAATTP
jgi:hypothetical protein